MKFKIYQAGKEVEADSLFRGFSEEDPGIFESLRTYGGKIFRLEDHLQRFEESAKTARGAVPYTRAALRRELESALKNFRQQEKSGGDLFLRITFYNNQLFVFIGERRHPAALYEKGIALKTASVRRSLFNASPPEAKTGAYQNAMLATLEYGLPPQSEWVFLDRNGFVTEVRTGNLFIAERGELLTPPVIGILDGVTRRFVIECARETGIKVKEIPLMRHQVYNASEAFLTNTSWEILPVREMDGRAVGKTVPGPLTKKLLQQFRAKIKKECF